MPAGRLSRLLLDLHAGAAAASVAHCKEALLAVVRRQLPFDSAIWGSGAEQPQLIFGVATLDFPLDRLIDYAAWQSADVLRAAVGSRPGICLRNEDIAPLEDHYASAIYRGFCGPAGLNHTLGIAEIDPITNVGELVFLFRADRAFPYTDAERDLLEQAMPHMVTAWRHRMLWEFARPGDSIADPGVRPQRGQAVIDSHGHVHASDAVFGLAVREAFPDWLGPLLPEPVVRAVRGGATVLRLGAQPLELIRGTDRHVLKLISVTRNGLSGAEFKVAALFARGLTAAAVAAELGLSRLTVRNHLTTIYQKLGIHTKVELARVLDRAVI